MSSPDSDNDKKGLPDPS